MKHILSVDNLTVHFPIKKGIFSKTEGLVRAVDGVSFSVHEHENLGLVGESGCGKTTTGLGIARLIEPTAGTVHFQGENISVLKKHALRMMRKQIQYIFQDPYSSLNPRMTVKQILSDPIDTFKLFKGKEKDERIAYILEKVGLSPEYEKRYPHEFSGGQRQRIGIARALVLNPLLIIGDEPVSALDVSIQAQIINLLLDLQKEFHLSYIVIAHDLAVVEYVCDTIAVMYLGKIVEKASYKDLCLRPKHPYSQALLSAVPSIDPHKSSKRVVVHGDVPSPINPPSGCSFHPRCSQRRKECCEIIPVIKAMGNDHFVRCHLY